MGQLLKSLIQQTGRAKDETRDPWVQGERFIHYTIAAPIIYMDMIYMYTVYIHMMNIYDLHVQVH